MVLGVVFTGLRLASNLVLVFEAQRVFGGVVKPTGQKKLREADRRVLKAVKTELRDELVNCGGHGVRTLFAGDPRDPPLVLIHGHSMNSTYWYRNFDDLVNMGYYVIALDMVGWGLSDRPDFRGTKAEDCVSFYLDPFVAWTKALGLQKFAIIAHSIGAYLAFEYAKAYPETVSRLTLITPAACEKKLALYRGFYFTATPQAVARRFGLIAYLMFELKFPREEAYMANNLKELTWHLACRPGASGDIAIKHLIQFKRWNQTEVKRSLIEVMQRLDMPVHVIAAEKDTLIVPMSVEKFYNALKEQGTDCTFDMALASDHCPFLETPEQFRSIIAKYYATK